MRIPELIPPATRTRNRISLEMGCSSMTEIRTNIYKHQIRKERLESYWDSIFSRDLITARITEKIWILEHHTTKPKVCLVFWYTPDCTQLTLV